MSELLKKVKATASTKAWRGAVSGGSAAMVIWAYATFAEKADCRETRIELQTLRETVGQMLFALEHEVQFTTVRTNPRKVIE